VITPPSTTLDCELQGDWLYAAQVAIRRSIFWIGHRALVKWPSDRLQVVEFTVEGHTEIVELLLKHGAKK